MDSPLPPLDGSLPTLPDIADFCAKHTPNKPWLVFPSKNAPHEITSISFLEIVQASHRVAHILRPGREGDEREVIALLLNTDTPLYAAVILGLLRAGFVPYPMSPRNSVQGICHMLEATSCTRILGQASTSSLIYQVQLEMQSNGAEVRIDSLPGLDDVFPSLFEDIQSNEPKPYPPASKPIDMNEPSMYIHSSGSTGFPKSIHFTHWRMLKWMANNVFGSTRGLRFGAMGLPTFHAMGMLLQLSYPLSTGNEVVVYTPQFPAPPVVPHPQNIYEVALTTGCTALLALPSFVEAWSHSSEVIDYLKTLRILIYGGGPLSFSVGDKLVQAGVNLCNGYGGTEFGNPVLPWDLIPRTSTKPDPDWYWYRVAENANVRFEHQGDGSYELVVVETENYHLAAYNVPGEKAYATSDLFEPHPSKSNLWKIVGRKDDVITLSTGEKIVPIPQESILNASPLIAGCAMFGREREQPGILVEPNPEDAIDPNNQSALVQLRNKLWPVIEEANSVAPGYAKIFKEMIIVADTDKPLPRSAKGAVIRKQALGLYAEEIEKLYETVAESTNVEGISPPAAWDAEHLQPWLLDQAATLVTNDHAFSMTSDIFQQGFDSLSATFLRNRIIGALRASEDPSLRQAANAISANIIFDCPTILQLAYAIHALVDPETDSVQQPDQIRLRVAEIEAMIAKYAADLPTPKARAVHAPIGAPVVLLTGSTGNIGSHILAYLLSDSRIGRVYALNRPSSDPLGRLKAALADRELPEALLDDPRFTSLVGDVTQDKFGLEDSQYTELLASVTYVIHNAWTVNFNLALQSFEGQVAGVRKLVDICACADQPMRLLITSSIGIANDWNPSNGPVPEHPLPDAAIAAGLGYVASKYVVEQILSAANSKGVAATTVRMGQACGPEATGAWGTSEWMPILVKSSIALGCLPEIHGPVAWMPLDAIGEAYVDWVVSRDDLPPLVNVVHPRPTTWDVILKGLREELGDALSMTPLQDWVNKLEERSANPTTQDLQDIPALKLLDFFRGLAQAESAESQGGTMNLAYETSRLLGSSSTMRELQPMSEEHARAWVRYWRASGFIKP